jgi:hypothetical protein
MIIGLSGYARVGKDAVADILVENFGFERLAFADKLRECLYAMDPIVLWDYEFGDLPEGVQPFLPLKFIIDTYTWDGYKSTGWGKHIRKYLQRFGTEVGRELLGDNIWVEATLIDLDRTKNYVVTDCRFLNEATAITTKAGKVWRINRPGVHPVNDHISEIGLDMWPFDVVIPNDGTLNDLKEVVGRAKKYSEYR